MAIDTTTPEPKVRVGRPWLVGLLALLLFGLLGTAVAYYGIQIPTAAPSKPPQKVEATSRFITSIELPTDDTPIPTGPHREEFRVACTVCHSPRLVFTQPLLTEKQWTGVVHKMIAKYGAPLSSEEEKHMVQYLNTVHGK